MCIRRNFHAYRADWSSDKGSDTRPFLIAAPPETDPQTAADSNAARIFLPEEHPKEPPKKLILLGASTPGKKSWAAQLLYSSIRSWNSGSTLLLHTEVFHVKKI